MGAIDNTTLTFDQIATFVGLHPLEIQALADEEVSIGIVPRNPIEKMESFQKMKFKSLQKKILIKKLTFLKQIFLSQNQN